MTELRQRLLFLLGALVVFRVGAHIPVPGIDPNAMAQLFRSAARHHSRHVQHVFRRCLGSIESLCSRGDALYLGLDHPAADVDGRASRWSSCARKVGLPAAIR
jgi:hypothetical protein